MSTALVASASLTTGCVRGRSGLRSDRLERCRPTRALQFALVNRHVRMSSRVAMDSPNERHEREVLTELIALYIDLPCLWDIGSELYKDRKQKTEAWELIKEKLKEIDPEANIAAAKKKIEHIRSAFKREYRKVKESKRTGAGANDVHVPNLWYFNLLLPIFEKKDGQTRCGVDTLSSDEESRSSGYEKGRKQKRTLEMKKQTLIETAQELLLQSDNRIKNQKKINSFGLYVGEQLDQVETFQRQVAEKLISDILFLAKTGNLNFESRVVSQNFAVSRSSSSSNFYTQQVPSYPIIHASLPRQHYQTSPSSYSQSSPSPQHIQPSPSPQHIQPSPSPQHIQPSPSPQHIQPLPSPQHFQPSPSPQHIQPSPSPQHIQQSPSPQKIQLSPSPYFQISPQGFQPAPPPHQIQPSLLPLSSYKQHFQASPPAQNSLLSTSTQKQFLANDKNENIVQISMPSPSHAVSNNTNSVLYEGPASKMSNFLIFKNNK